MKLAYREDDEHPGQRKWWIVGVPGSPDHGPYDSRREATEAKAGLLRFFQEYEKLDKKSHKIAHKVLQSGDRCITYS